MHYVMTFTNQINQQPGKFTPNRQCRVAFRVISMAKKQVFLRLLAPVSQER